MIRPSGLISSSFEYHSNPRIGYDNLFVGATLSADGSDEDNAFDGLTYDYWTAEDYGGTITATLTSGRECNYFGVAGHDLHLVSGTVALEYFDYATMAWVELAAFAPGSASPMMATFDRVGSDRYRVVVTGGATIAVLSAGVYLEMERGSYGGFAPPRFARSTRLLNNGAQNGQFLGRSVVRQGWSGTLNLEDLSNGWVRTHLDPFLSHARESAWFLQWDATEHPNEAAYCWTSDEPRITNQSGVYMSTSLSVEGIGP